MVRHIVVMGCLLGLGACGGDDPAPGEPAATSASDETADRDEDPRLRAIHGADAVGYDGDAIKGAVEGMLDTVDTHQQQIDEARE